MTKLQKLNRDIKALGKSIEHWKRMVTGKDYDGSTTSCALCKIYFSWDTCKGCPVSEQSGHAGCRNTPWYLWRTSCLNHNTLKTQTKHAAAEVRFLQKLRKNAVARRKRLV